MDIRRSGQENDKEQTNETANQQRQQQTAKTGGSSSLLGSVLLVLGIIVLIGVGVYLFRSGSLGSGSGGGSDLSGSGPVARVGGEPVPRSEFRQQLQNLRQGTSSQAQQFKSLSETRQQELVLAGIINQRLLETAAKQAGVSVSDSQVDQRLQSRIQQLGGESAFQQQLDQAGLTRSEVRENLRQQLLINQYVQQAAGTTTDQQIQQLYDQYTAQIRQRSGATSTQVPTLEQLRPQLEASIQQRNQQQLLQQAREQIKVEVLIDGVSYPPTTQQQGGQQTGQQQQQTQQQAQPQTQNQEATGNTQRTGGAGN